MATFSADVDDWIRESEARVETVLKMATQELFYGVLKPVREGGRMRIETGFLRSSFTVTLNAPMTRAVPRPDGDATYSVDTGAISLVINQAEIGQTIYGVFAANYARPREYGSRGKPGDGFVMTNAARWQDYVDEAVLAVRRG